MYGSHDMRHTGFRRLTVVIGTPGFWGVTRLVVSFTCMLTIQRVKHFLLNMNNKSNHSHQYVIEL